MKKIFYTLIILILALSASLYYLNSPPGDMQEQPFIVSHGESIRTIASHLQERNLIRNKHFFVYASYLLKRRYIRAGKYDFLGDSTSIEILQKLTRGDVIAAKVVIPEGFNLYQIADRMEANNICPASIFLLRSGDTEFLKSIRIHSSSSEGYLFPDTYVFPEASDPRDIIAAMAHKMKSVANDISLDSGSRDLHRVLTLASLIEKEAKIPAERGLISSVFHNRLKKNMKLDCDPTVRYAVKKFTGPITISDLNSDSPYNTYKTYGLPPTPICSPGRESIIAAQNPDTTDYLFFVAKNDGTHHFSKTLKEHNSAVQQYQRH